MSKRVLIVDDEDNIGLSLRLILEREGYTVEIARCLADFTRLRSRPAVYLLDVRLPDASGIDILRHIRQSGSDAPVIMISGQATIAEAVQATRLGAYDFLEKPLSRDKVLLTVANALAAGGLRQENAQLRELAGHARIIGDSPAWRHAIEQASLGARSDARILLLGESGTGKELLAEHVHRSSPFSGGPFVKVNCAAIPADLLESELFGHEKGAFTGAATARRGKFELADNGSLFLDEVGDLSTAAQAKLLRVLQEGELHRLGGEALISVRVRVIAATNRDLAAMARQEKFREDLYYRLSVLPIRVPPLRERPEDIAPLAHYFLEEFCRRNNFRAKCFEPEVLPILENYSWPGNVRELRNLVERMAILSVESAIGPGAVPLELITAAPRRSRLQDAREDAERDQLRRALDAAGGNVSAAARTLGVERTNIHKRMKALGLTRSSSEP